MVPPPDSTGDEFPDFDKMTFEEQMAWLESLARRQGAKEEEFTTAADIDVPIPENPVIDEPGYIPFSASDQPEGKQSRPAAKSAVEKPMPPEAVPPVEQAPAEIEVPEEVSAEPAMDPMNWLESLTSRPGEEATSEILADLGLEDMLEDTSEFDALFQQFEEQPLSDTDELNLDFSLESMEEQVIPDLPELPSAAADLKQFEAIVEPSSEEVEDLLGGMDPMLWLESLAVRQGVKSDELTTSANAEIAEVPEDTVIDEPGYVPYDIVSGGFKSSEPPASVPAEESVSFASEPEPPAAAEPAVASSEDDPLGGMDPMRWLESLAKRQGAKTEELFTSADLEIPELPPDTVVDEPGYVAFSAFDSPEEPIRMQRTPEPPMPPAAPPPVMPEEMPAEPEELPAQPEFEALDQSLSWLEDLAGEAELGLSDLTSFEEPLTAPEPEAEFDANEALADTLAGMTDEEIAYAQAHHQLTGEQELAWLQRQARKLAETRHVSEEGSTQFDELPPAEPGDIPDWLVQMRGASEQELAEAAFAALSESESEVPADLLAPETPATAPEADWLTEPVLPVSEVDVSDWLSEVPATENLTELSLGTDVESLWADVPEQPQPEPAAPESELEAFLEGRLPATELDQLADALDAEYDRRLIGDESEPEWYTAAVEQTTGVETPVAPEQEEPPVVAQPPAEMGLAQAAPVEMPDWLKETIDEPETAPAEGSVPDWLTERVDVPAPMETPMPDWLAEPITTPEEQAASLDWLSVDISPAPVESAKPVAPPTPPPPPPVAPRVPEVEAAAPAPKPAPPLPDNALFATYRQRLETDPNDHPNRLALARALWSHEEVGSSMDHYEALIESSQLLQDVVDDLSGMVQDTPEVPRLRRLLGDTYMRRGMLQEALDAYRSALEQL